MWVIASEWVPNTRDNHHSIRFPCKVGNMLEGLSVTHMAITSYRIDDDSAWKSLKLAFLVRLATCLTVTHMAISWFCLEIIHNSFPCKVGDMLESLSGGLLPATLHRWWIWSPFHILSMTNIDFCSLKEKKTIYNVEDKCQMSRAINCTGGKKSPVYRPSWSNRCV